MTAVAVRCPGSGTKPRLTHHDPDDRPWTVCDGCQQPRKLIRTGRIRIHAVNPKTAALAARSRP